MKHHTHSKWLYNFLVKRGWQLQDDKEVVLEELDTFFQKLAKTGVSSNRFYTDKSYKGEKRTEVIRVRVQPTLKKHLSEVATDIGMSVSALIETVLKDVLYNRDFRYTDERNKRA